MKFIEDSLEALDKYFLKKKEHERWLIIFMGLSIIFYFSYSYYLPYSQDIYAKNKENKEKIQKDIVKYKAYLHSVSFQGNLNYYTQKLDENIRKKEKKILGLNNKIRYIDISVKELSHMSFHKKSWSSFLHFITSEAQESNLKLKKISSKYIVNKEKFGPVLEVNISSKGSYKSIITFMNTLEQHSLITNIDKSQLFLDTNTSKINANIKISVWGLKK